MEVILISGNKRGYIEMVPKLNPQQLLLKEILLNAFFIGESQNDVTMIEVVEAMKKQLLTILEQNNR